MRKYCGNMDEKEIKKEEERKIRYKIYKNLFRRWKNK